MPTCESCGAQVAALSAAIPFCADCLRNRWHELKSKVEAKHRESRRRFGLAEVPPSSEEGIACAFCARDCRIGEGERGYCGLRTVREGRFTHLAGTAERGLLQWYRDPLPTNCVADWVCEGSRQRGFHNLAVFYGSCTFNCLFCQNWHYRDLVGSLRPLVSSTELADVATERTFCICFFGGDPSSQMPHALSTARKLAARRIRICWETNGSMNPRFLRQAVKLSLQTGGIIKFDLKAFSPGIHRALTGADNERTLKNFALATESIPAGEHPPLVVASTLLVPGYVDAHEVGEIATFIARFSTEIPYSLLGFHPQFEMNDLPTTSRRHAEAALEAAREAGLTKVRVGNIHLLSQSY